MVLPLQAATFEETLVGYQEQWAHINYSVDKKQREASSEALAKQLAAMMQQYPDRPEPIIWHGIVLSTWAGAKGGLGALGLVKEARTDFEHSLQLSPDACMASPILLWEACIIRCQAGRSGSVMMTKAKKCWRKP
ncbi:MAG: hypothetical protein R3F38_12190 [Gammaproteobacteria bacterium]